MGTRNSDCDLLLNTPSETGIISCEVDFNSGEYLFEFVTYGILLNIVGCLGILGNVISMVILSKPQMKSSINYLLIGLARCDTALIVSSMLLYGLPSIHAYTNSLFTYYYIVFPHIAVVLYLLAVISHSGSVYLTVAVTLERFLAVCYPLRARSLCTYGRARICVFVIIALSVLYNLPRFWESNLHSSFLSSSFNTTIYCVLASKMRRNPTYVAVYLQWCYLVFQYFLPFILLVIFNITIALQVRKANADRQHMSGFQRREIRLATMLLFVVFVFFVLNILALIANILEALLCIINNRLIKISNLLVTINSSVNFIIYVTFGDKFRCLFMELFCKNRLLRRLNTQDSTSLNRTDQSHLQLQPRIQHTNLTDHSTKLIQIKPANTLVKMCKP